jgi:hypothetical protein
LDEIRDELSLATYIAGLAAKLHQDADILALINASWGYVAIPHRFFTQQKIASGDSSGGEEPSASSWRIANLDRLGERCTVDDGFRFGSLCIHASEAVVAMLSLRDALLSELGIWLVCLIFREELRNGEKLGE